MRSDLIDVTVQKHADTAKAVLISSDGDEKKAKLIALSQCEIEPVKGSSTIFMLTLSEWLAKEKGLTLNTTAPAQFVQFDGNVMFDGVFVVASNRPGTACSFGAASAICPSERPRAIAAALDASKFSTFTRPVSAASMAASPLGETSVKLIPFGRMAMSRA